MLVDQVGYVSNTSEWSQVSRRVIVKDFVAQYCNLILYALGRLLMGGLGDGSPTISKMGGFATKGLH